MALHIRLLFVGCDVSDAQALKQVVKHIPETVIEARAINEGKEEALYVNLVNLLLLFEVLLDGFLRGLDFCEAVLERLMVLRQYLIGAFTHVGLFAIAGTLNLLVVAGLEDLVNDAAHELLGGPVVH